MRPSHPRRSAGRLAALPFVLACAAALFASRAEAASHCGADGTQPGGAVYRICMPDPGTWNGDLVVWAHGYVEPRQPVAIPEDQLCLGEGFCLPEVINGLGYGFATTSYRNNGLVTTGVADVVEVVDLFAAQQGTPRRVFITGASEGGLVAARALEQRPDVFAGGIAACGPIGDIQRIIDYYGDFRVVFDYFFPGLMPGTLLDVPADLVDNFEDDFTNTIWPVVSDTANGNLLSQLLKVTRAPHDPGSLPTIQITVHDALWYNVHAAADLFSKAGGSPYDNMLKHYTGSWNDAALNAAVARYAANPDAVAFIHEHLLTTGLLTVPMVNLHTTRDQQVAFAQELLYGQKLRATGSQSHRVLIPSFRYEHCNFKPWEALLAFGVMLRMSGSPPPAGFEAVLADSAERAAYRAAAASLSLDSP